MKNGYFIFRVFSKKDFSSRLILILHNKLECLTLANEKSKVKRSKEVFTSLSFIEEVVQVRAPELAAQKNFQRYPDT